VCDIGAVEWRPATPRNADSVGLYYKASSQFYLRHPDASQPVVTFGDPSWDSYPVAGDWDEVVCFQLLELESSRYNT
jgi:hypothetical protein